ncbi:MAG: hypothetical protein AAF845_10085 [Bacteroidota bacterium]
MPVEKTFGMRLAPHERRQIERLAEARGTTMKDAVLDAVRQQLADLAVTEEPEPYVPTGRLKGAEHLVGCFDSGLGDLSTNPAHMEGFGE